MYWKENKDWIFALHAHGLVQSGEDYSRIRNVEGYASTGDSFRANGITDMSCHSFLFLQRRERLLNGVGGGERMWEYHDRIWEVVYGIEFPASMVELNTTGPVQTFMLI